MTTQNGINDRFDNEPYVATAESSACFTYRLSFGWNVSVHDGQAVVELDSELAGVQLPTRLAVDVLAVLRTRGLECPIVALTGRGQGNCVLLFRPDGTADAGMFPTDAAPLRIGDQVLLPTGGPRSRARWLNPPHAVVQDASLPTARVLAGIIADVLRWDSDRSSVLSAAA